MKSNALLSTVIPLVEETLRIVGGAAAKGSAVFTECLTKPVSNGWILLEAELATAAYAAYIDLNAAMTASQSAVMAYLDSEPEVVAAIEQQLFKHSSTSYIDYLDRAFQVLSDSQAAIYKRDEDLIQAHAQIAKSAINKLSGLANITNERLACIAQYAGESFE
ncbi:hypothetical protein ABS648_15970 [Pseudomonas solani]|uniref:Uncharacterized protein n=1 Tax=Pseudomonas solani TaxID=2731552 RepID=A0AAU7XXA8_9PSED